MGKPAARLTDMHTCPMVTPGTPPIPHVGGPISGPCVPPVLIGFLPAATVGDMCVCVGPPDTIAMGSPTVFIGGKMAARMGDPTAHGGVIVVGCPTVLIGEVGSGGASGGGGGGFAVPKPVEEQSWWNQAIEQALKGEFYEGERTTVGTIAEIIAGLNPLADARDVTGASKKMWNDPSWANAGNVVLNTVGAIPVVGDAAKAIGKGAKATKHAKKVKFAEGLLENAATPGAESMRVALRKGVADKFYTDAAEMSSRQTKNHLKGVDMTKPVHIEDIPAGTELIQWSKIDKKTGKPVPGNYFTKPGVDPATVGIDISDRVPVKHIIKEPIQGLRSTAADIEAWDKPGKMYKGGGEQLFIPNAVTETTHQ